jgi:hypothetical protein
MQGVVNNLIEPNFFYQEQEKKLVILDWVMKSMNVGYLSSKKNFSESNVKNQKTRGLSMMGMND